MTGYVGTRFAESFGVITDYVDPELTDLIKVHMDSSQDTNGFPCRHEHNLLTLYRVIHFESRCTPESTVTSLSARPSVDTAVSAPLSLSIAGYQTG